MPVKADRAVWEKLKKGPAGIRWDSVDKKVWNNIGGNREEILSREKFAGFKTAVKDSICRNKGKASAKKQGEIGGTLRDLRGVKKRNNNINVFERPNGLHENAETAMSCRGPGPARKKEVRQ